MEFRFLIADGQAAAQRGGAPNHYNEYFIEASGRKEAYDQLVPQIYGYNTVEEWAKDDYMVGEDEDEIADFLASFDGEEYMDSLDFTGGDPFVVAEAINGDVDWLVDKDYVYDEIAEQVEEEPNSISKIWGIGVVDNADELIANAVKEVVLPKDVYEDYVDSDYDIEDMIWEYAADNGMESEIIDEEGEPVGNIDVASYKINKLPNGDVKFYDIVWEANYE